MRNKGATVLLAAVLLSPAASPAWAGFEEGVAAFKRKDHETALKEFRPLAKAGNAQAQFFLGWMYDSGRGVPQNFREAHKWFRLAAEQGEARAQILLGIAYLKGKGVPEDLTEAYMWLDLAAAQGQKYAPQIRDGLILRMTWQQAAEALRRVKAWKPKPWGVLGKTLNR